jgi:hypothetical protein
MRCSNCSRSIPDDALVCQYCEAVVAPPPTREELDIARQVVEQLPPEALAELQEAIRSSETCDKFVNAIFIGPCPTCGSSNTGDCENDPEIENLLMARCYDCGQFWCSECETLLKSAKDVCACWDEDDDMDWDEDDGAENLGGDSDDDDANAGGDSDSSAGDE